MSSLSDGQYFISFLFQKNSSLYEYPQSFVLETELGLSVGDFVRGTAFLESGQFGSKKHTIVKLVASFVSKQKVQWICARGSAVSTNELKVLEKRIASLTCASPRLHEGML
jgi:hypothetical protein